MSFGPPPIGLAVELPGRTWSWRWRCIARGLSYAFAGALTLAMPIALVVSALAARTACCCISCDNPPEDVAAMMVKKYAFELHPAWAEHHPKRSCPGSLAELERYAESSMSLRDPWGAPYELSCRPGHTALVRSRGPDGVLGTADDIASEP